LVTQEPKTKTLATKVKNVLFILFTTWN